MNEEILHYAGYCRTRTMANQEFEGEKVNKIIINIIGLLASLFALYTFVFVAELEIIWKVILIIAAVGWIITCTINLLNGKIK